jgi:hypothetical protein
VRLIEHDLGNLSGAEELPIEARDRATVPQLERTLWAKMGSLRQRGQAA